MNASYTMLKLLRKWLLKIVSDAHNVIVGLILVAFVPQIVVYANRILNQTTKALNQPLPIWVMVSTGLGVLLLFLLFLKKSLSAPITKSKENKSISEKPKNIDEDQMKILSIFMNTNETHIGESTLTGLSPFNYHETKHILSSLKSLNFIGDRAYYDETESEYYITDEGKAFSLKKKLV